MRFYKAEDLRLTVGQAKMVLGHERGETFSVEKVESLAGGGGGAGHGGGKGGGGARGGGKGLLIAGGARGGWRWQRFARRVLYGFGGKAARQR